MCLGHKRAAVLPVLEAGSNDHHGQGTSEHAIHLARDLVRECRVVAGQKGGERARESSVKKVVQTDKERS